MIVDPLRLRRLTEPPDATIPGVKDLNQQYQEQFGPGDYRPNLVITYWGFRAMILFGAVAATTGSQPFALLSLLPFLLAGAWVLGTVRIPEAKAAGGTPARGPG